MEYYNKYQRGFEAQGQGAPTDDLPDLSLTDKGEGKRTINSWHEKQRILSFFGRLNYDFKDKYLLSFVFRRDGYSSLLGDNRWGFFPGVSAGWIFGREDFIKEAIPVMSFGKLRASYGINGNASGIGAYTLQGSYGSSNSNGSFNYNGNTSYLITELPNPNLRWEKTATFEVGADLSFFANRLNTNLTYYNRLTSDKYAALSFPTSTGFSSVTNNNGEKLRDGGNTVVLVEHHRKMIEMADHIVEMGPEPGMAGGRVLFEGSYKELLKSDTPTGEEMRLTTSLKAKAREAKGIWRMEHIHLHNLKDITIEFPIGNLVVIAGVAGSGKSSLMESFYRSMGEDVVFVSQRAAGASLRSTPATYLGVADEIRKIFAKRCGQKASLFSFNGAGKCPACKGKGVIVSDMAFMDDIETSCDVCKGLRYSKEVLQYEVDGKNIAEVMDLTVAQAGEFFRGTKISEALEPLEKVGLSYLHLNQALSTLSGGELQRMKFASYLGSKDRIFILDEPTNGLHIKNVRSLLKLLNQMVDEGNSIFVIEHNIEFIKSADYVVELGPEGGDAGGRLLFAGTPSEMKMSEKSVTAEYL